jgi:hypothetical protein
VRVNHVALVVEYLRVLLEVHKMILPAGEVGRVAVVYEGATRILLTLTSFVEVTFRWRTSAGIRGGTAVVTKSAILLNT